jgi:hypothetical protein
MTSLIGFPLILAGLLSWPQLRRSDSSIDPFRLNKRPQGSTV